MPIYYITKMLYINIFNILTSDLELQILRVFVLCMFSSRYKEQAVVTMNEQGGKKKKKQR